MAWSVRLRIAQYRRHANLQLNQSFFTSPLTTKLENKMNVKGKGHLIWKSPCDGQEQLLEDLSPNSSKVN